MRYVILLILWIITVFLSHLQHSNLLTGDPGMVGEYIGSVLLGPLLLPVLVSGILCTFTKKRVTSPVLLAGAVGYWESCFYPTSAIRFVCSPRGTIRLRRQLFP